MDPSSRKHGRRSLWLSSSPPTARPCRFLYSIVAPLLVVSVNAVRTYARASKKKEIEPQFNYIRIGFFAPDMKGISHLSFCYDEGTSLQGEGANPGAPEGLPPANEEAEDIEEETTMAPRVPYGKLSLSLSLSLSPQLTRV